MMQPTDAELTQGINRGDPGAIEQFVRRWEQMMLVLATRIVGQIADAEEIRQAVLLRIIRNPQALSGVEHVAAWIRRCVMNEAIDWLRRRDRELGTPTGSLEEAPDLWSTESETSDGESPAAHLSRALRHLDPPQRAILSLRFDEGLTIRQIAATLQLPHTTVHSQLQSTLQQLRSLLSNEHPMGGRYERIPE